MIIDAKYSLEFSEARFNPKPDTAQPNHGRARVVINFREACVADRDDAHEAQEGSGGWV